MGFEMKFRIKVHSNEDSKRLAFLLTGRGQQAEHFLGLYSEYSDDMNYVSIEPEEWYPIPNGAQDQRASIDGIKTNLYVLHKMVKRISKEFNIEKENVSLIGFSAGAVMALELMAHNKKNFHSVISHAGAILRNDNFPKCKNSTPNLLIHNENDDCFYWDERFIPMCQCLKDKEYWFKASTQRVGGHTITVEDIKLATDFMRQQRTSRLI